jgi:hypothetical protein
MRTHATRSLSHHAAPSSPPCRQPLCRHSPPLAPRQSRAVSTTPARRRIDDDEGEDGLMPFDADVDVPAPLAAAVRKPTARAQQQAPSAAESRWPQQSGTARPAAGRAPSWPVGFDARSNSNLSPGTGPAPPRSPSSSSTSASSPSSSSPFPSSAASLEDTRPRWSYTPERMKAPFNPNVPKDPRRSVWLVNDDPRLLDDMYTRLLGRDGPRMLQDEVKWLAVTHKSYDQGRRGFNDKLAYFGERERETRGGVRTPPGMSVC